MQVVKIANMIHQNSFKIQSTTKYLHNFAIPFNLNLNLTGAVRLSCIPSCCNLNFNEESLSYQIILSTISGYNNICICMCKANQAE